ncbi:MAG: 1,4-alpha-glucan branching protein domain-containing protein [Polyangiaceae bacterium]
MTGVRPRGLWLPECAFAPAIDDVLASAGVAFSVLDAHGLALAQPRQDVASLGEGDGALVVPVSPIRSPSGAMYFGRDLFAGRSVWAMDGYPSHPDYREFHRDLGFDLPEADLLGEVGPGGTRVATGIKPYRITGSERKMPYRAEAAEALAGVHAEAWVRDRAWLFGEVPRGKSPPLSVAPFDAELFGHFWHEGPVFLERALRALARAAEEGGPEAISLSEYSERFPEANVAAPAVSTWGEGGFAETWTGPRTASLWRHVHHASAEVLGAVRSAGPVAGVRGEALDQAIVEALLVQSSDFPFMVHQGTTVEYALSRTALHAANARRLSAIALTESPTPDDVAFTRAARERAPLFRDLAPGELRAALHTEERV